MKIYDVFNKVLIGGVSFGAIYCLLGCNIEYKNNNMAASGDIIYNSIFDVKNYLLEDYDEVSNLKELDKVCVDGVDNYSQTKLNSYCNNTYAMDISGTCTIVACLGMVNYYGNVKNEGIYTDSPEEAFYNIYKKCYNKGYTTKKSGTSMSKENNCLSTAFDTYSIDRSGNTEWYYLESKIRKYTENEEPVIFDLTDHSTVAKGYVTYSFDYKETYTTGALWWKKKKTRITSTTKDFIIVNEGWGWIDGGLVDCKRIKNVTYGMQICYAEE